MSLTVALEILDIIEAVAPALKRFIAEPGERQARDVIEAALTGAIKNPLAEETIVTLFALVNVAQALGVKGDAPYEAGPGKYRGR